MDEEPQRVRDVLRHGALLQLYKKVTKNRRGVEVWINKSKPSESGKNRCVRIAMQKLVRWVAHGDETFTGRGDHCTVSLREMKHMTDEGHWPTHAVGEIYWFWSSLTG